MGSQKELGAVTVDGNFLFEETRVCRCFPFTRHSARLSVTFGKVFIFMVTVNWFGETFLHNELGGLVWNQIAALE